MTGKNEKEAGSVAQKPEKEKTVARNKRASHDYFLEERIEAGMALTGTEIKSIREGRVQFKDSFITIIKGEAWIKGMHISPYKYGNIFNVDETRDRKLLLHKYEIRKLYDKVRLKGYTLIPVRIYLKDGKAKMEIALAKGKNLFDKRESEKLRDAKREMEKALKLRG
ncbi:MAG: SsrA-binding protein SmpB [Solobacterium sp.]|nr:SsrA-binding protein SmpB [Solobacterium sp.]